MLLLESLVDRARARGLVQLVGQVLMANEQMLDVIKHLGLAFTLRVDQGVAEVVIDVRDEQEHDDARARRERVAIGGPRETSRERPRTEAPFLEPALVS